MKKGENGKITTSRYLNVGLDDASIVYHPCEKDSSKFPSGLRNIFKKSCKFSDPPGQRVFVFRTDTTLENNEHLFGRGLVGQKLNGNPTKNINFGKFLQAI